MAKALSELQNYLRRDEHASRLLGAVSRRQRESSRALSRLQDEVAECRENATVAHEGYSRVKMKLETSQRALEKEESISAQLRRDVRQLETQIADLQKDLEPPDLEAPETVPDDFQKDVAGLSAITRALLRRLKVAPRVHRYSWSKSERLVAFDVRELVKNYRHEEYTTLGMLATVGAMSHMPFVFRWSAASTRELKVLGKVPDEEWDAIVGRYVKTIANWIGPTRAERAAGLHLPKEVPSPHPKDK